MSGFIYFLPLELKRLVVDGRIDAKQLAEFTLQDVLADAVNVPADCIVTPVTDGPSGKPGVLLFPLSPGVEVPRVPGYLPDSQRWHEGRNYWLGFDGEPPTPDQLARTSTVLGYLVPDGHGREWHVPLIRGLDRPYGALPCDYEFGDDFLPSEVLRARYRSLWRDSATMWNAYDQASGGVPDPFAAQFAARCLSVNYRIGPAELNVLAELGLDVFDRASVLSVAGTAIDSPAVLEYIEQKKTIPPLPEPAGTTSSRGTPDETPTGDQHAASCD